MSYIATLSSVGRQITVSLVIEVVPRGSAKNPCASPRVVGPSTHDSDPPEPDSATEMPCLTSPTTEPTPTSFEPCWVQVSPPLHYVARGRNGLAARGARAATSVACNRIPAWWITEWVRIPCCCLSQGAE
jgi:hypothetical protein